MENVHLNNVDILESFEKIKLKFLKPIKAFVNIKVTFTYIKENLHLHNVFIHWKPYQNILISVKERNRRTIIHKKDSHSFHL